MLQSQPLKQKLKDLLGTLAYHRNGRLDRAYVASKIFKDTTLLAQVNRLVHPAVKIDFTLWAEAQHSPYVLEESAILFENGLDENFDKVIVVVADKALRIARVIKRDKTSEEQVEARISKQLPDEKKRRLANFVIENNEDSNLSKQISEIHNTLLSLSKSKS